MSRVQSDPFIFKGKTILTALLSVQACVFFYFAFLFLNTDLWNDEIYTLKYFTFVPLKTTLLDYHTPNNHVFFNLVNNLYLKIIGISFHELLDSPWKIRIVSLIYTLLTIFFSWKTARKFFGERAALFTLIILFSTIPFLNYVVQVRSYAMGTMLLTLIVYHALSFREDQKKSRLFYLLAFSFCFLYCNPANAYFLGSLIIIFFFTFIYSRKKDAQKSKTAFRLLSALGGGLVLALIGFAPIFKEVFFNDFARYRDISAFYALEFTLGNLKYFITFRWHLLLLLLFVIWYQARKYREIRIREFYFFSAFLILPFILFSVRGDRPPERIFTVLIPVFSIYLAIGLDEFLKEFEVKKFLQILSPVFMLASMACFVAGIFVVRAQLRKDLSDSGRSQDNFYNYYQHYFHPNHEALLLKNFYNKNNSIVIVAGGEPYDLPLYLEKEKIDFLNATYLDSIPKISGKRIFVFSTYLNELNAKLKAVCPACRTELLSEEISYHNLVEIKRTDSLKQ